MLDVLLVAGLLWMGYLWNGEKEARLARSDEIEKLKATVLRLNLDLNQAQEAGVKTADELASTKELLAQSAKDLQDKGDALEVRTAEAEELRTAAKALKARVDELQGYQSQARQAVVAEKKPVAAAP